MVDFPANSTSFFPLGISGRSLVSVCPSRLSHNTDRDADDKFSLLDEGEFFSKSLPHTGLFKDANFEDGSARRGKETRRHFHRVFSPELRSPISFASPYKPGPCYPRSIGYSAWH